MRGGKARFATTYFEGVVWVAVAGLGFRGVDFLPSGGLRHGLDDY